MDYLLLEELSHMLTVKLTQWISALHLLNLPKKHLILLAWNSHKSNTSNSMKLSLLLLSALWNFSILISKRLMWTEEQLHLDILLVFPELESFNLSWLCLNRTKANMVLQVSATVVVVPPPLSLKTFNDFYFLYMSVPCFFYLDELFQIGIL